MRLLHTLLARGALRFDAIAWLASFALLSSLAACAKQADEEELCAALSQHHLAQLYAEGLTLSCAGIKLVAPTQALLSSLRGTDTNALRTALGAQKASALAIKSGKLPPAPNGKVQDTSTPLERRLSGFAFVPGLRAVAFSTGLALYAPTREPELSARERDGLAYVARALLRGAREPSLNSFPPALRRVERVEVMVLLRERGSARLWRSARGTSLARALLTATRVARDRWRERESAMGGALGERLLDLDVEVSLLSEDGVIAGPTQKLLDATIGPEHGVGFEYKSGWHYLLPEDVKRRGNGSPYRALLSLMSEQGIPSTALAAGALRVYRFVTLTLGTSRAPLGASPG